MININKKLLPRGGRVLAALSGGADSVCLLHQLYSLRHELGLTVIAAHYSHGIRTECAADEEEFVHNLCENLGIEYHIGRGDVPTYAGEHGMGLEEAARTLRYGFLYDLAEQLECEVIAVAHNREDSAETVLFNLTRGAGLSGLAGIPAVNDRVVRPLLGISRKEIEAYNEKHGLAWLTDESNADIAFSRNRIRHEVLPHLRQINPDADAAICRAADRLAQTQDFILQSALQLLSCDRQLGRIDRRLLRSAHPALYHAVFTLLLREVKADSRVLDARKTENVAALALGDRVSGEIELGQGICARVEYTDLCMVNPHLEAQHESREEIELHPGVPVLWNGWEIELDAAEGITFAVDAIEGPVVVRSRRAGDRIALSSGHKSIKKLMIDRKIPAKSRDRIPLICDNNKVLLVGDIDYDRHAAGHHSKSVKIKCRRIML